ncbi:HAD domain-containing protein [Paraburkholderia panacisoli]|uniref:HAD domain-containing protein n=1 Tax=Paraburkholderia panacisoli TaxID=2603818 RepID=UPI001FE6D45B|nr:HAD domain-containing protein [Paraburkholderia panacisoli]
MMDHELPNGITGAPRKLDSDTDVLYVDFDNCLHSCDAYVTAAGIVPSDPTVGFFEFAGVLETMLAPYPALQIVLSTSWVEAIGFEAALNSLPFASLRARVVGSTFSRGEDFLGAWREIPRGQQVRRHVRRHGIKKWMALDDMREGFEGVEGHLVHCQPGVGLGDKDVQKLFAERLAALFGTAGLLSESRTSAASADGGRT